MRVLRASTLCALVTFGVAAWSTVAAAQSSAASASATAVLGAVQQYYANASHLTADFRQVVTNATFGTTTSSDGKLWVAKPGSFRWDYTEKQKGGGVVVRKTFKQVFFVVDPADGHIQESIVIDSNGDTNDFHFYSPDLKAAVKSSWFVVDPSTLPGYKVVTAMPHP